MKQVIGYNKFAVLFIVTAFIINGCASIPKPNEIILPTPISGNSGAFMCPFTEDGELAPWVLKAVAVELAGKLGKEVGKYAGKKLVDETVGNVPFIGGWLGGKAGKAIARKIALEMVGGEEYMKETSTLSFNSLDDMSRFIYGKYSGHVKFDAIFKLLCDLYPDLGDKYLKAIKSATRKA